MDKNSSENYDATKLLFKAGLSLFIEKSSYPTIKRKNLYDELASDQVVEPLNREEDLYYKFLKVLGKHQITLSSDLENRNKYWTEGTEYNLFEEVGISMQFTDHHEATIRNDALPPAQDLEKFINIVLANSSLVTLDRQFDILLNITNNSVIGAANLGMLATRFISRFADFRVYPLLTIEGKDYTSNTDDSEINNLIRKWNSKIARFETYSNVSKSDGIGDNYYFWTHLFGALILSSNDVKSKAIGEVFKRGTELMIFAKYTVARRRGSILPHFEASQLV